MSLAQGLKQGWLHCKRLRWLAAVKLTVIGQYDVRERLQQYAFLVRLDRPIGTLLLLWPTLWALAIAGNGHPNQWVLLVFVCGVILMRSAGCAINDFADRHIDIHVARTQLRPLVTGKVSPKEALAVFGLLSLCAFLLVLTMNSLTIQLSFVAVLLAASYPFMKRFHHLPQVHLGLAFGMAIPMAFAAELDTVPKVAWLLFIANLLWTMAYDTMYAMADREDDIKIGVKSSALLFGDADRVIIAVLQVMMLLTFLLVGRELDLSVWYYLGLAVAAILALYQQLMIVYRVPEYCLAAFLNNHWSGAAIFAGLMLHYLFLF
ncbi:MAG: 4-hydroxybenzoate octaprenyltransferase [Gammaproteobacteria bacterium]|nr:4-hydroxybenzoate octaprenyltransferase [Gammaproteobacteria bacterium]